MCLDPGEPKVVEGVIGEQGKRSGSKSAPALPSKQRPVQLASVVAYPTDFHVADGDAVMLNNKTDAARWVTCFAPPPYGIAEFAGGGSAGLLYFFVVSTGGRSKIGVSPWPKGDDSVTQNGVLACAECAGWTFSHTKQPSDIVKRDFTVMQLTSQHGHAFARLS